MTDFDGHTRDYGQRVIARLPRRASTDLELAAVAGQQDGVTLPADTVRQLCAAYLDEVLARKESDAARARLFDQLIAAERQAQIALGVGALYERQNRHLRVDALTNEQRMGWLESRVRDLEGRASTRRMDWDTSETDVVCVDNLDGPTVDRTPTRRDLEPQTMAAAMEAGR